VILCILVELSAYRKTFLAQYLNMESVGTFKFPLDVLRVEAAYSSDTLLNLYHITRRHIADVENLYYMLYQSLSVYQLMAESKGRT
jgi:hypothetical protein